MKRGVTAADTRDILVHVAGITEGRSYGLPAYLLGGKFFARFRDDDTVLVLRLGSIDDRDVLMNLDPRAFFVTDHYRNHPSVLIRLAEVQRDMLADVVQQASRAAAAKPRRGRKSKR